MQRENAALEIEMNEGMDTEVKPEKSTTAGSHKKKEEGKKEGEAKKESERKSTTESRREKRLSYSDGKNQSENFPRESSIPGQVSGQPGSE